MALRRFESGDTEWAIELNDRKQTVHLGSKGGRSRTQLFMFPSAEAAARDADEKIAAKLLEGFTELGVPPPAVEETIAFETMTVSEAQERELLDEEQIEAFGLSPDDDILVHKGDLRATSDLAFDSGDTYVIDGAMETRGSVIQSDPLVVRGNVRARDFETWGWSDIHGTVTLDGYLYGNSSCDCTMDAGKITAQLVIDDGHTFAADTSGCVTLALMQHGGGFDEPTCSGGEEERILVDEVLTDGTLDVDKLRERSEQRKPLLRGPR